MISRQGSLTCGQHSLVSLRQAERCNLIFAVTIPPLRHSTCETLTAMVPNFRFGKFRAGPQKSVRMIVRIRLESNGTSVPNRRHPETTQRCAGIDPEAGIFSIPFGVQLDNYFPFRAPEALLPSKITSTCL